MARLEQQCWVRCPRGELDRLAHRLNLQRKGRRVLTETILTLAGALVVAAGVVTAVLLLIPSATPSEVPASQNPYPTSTTSCGCREPVP